MSKFDFIVENLLITKDNEKMESVKVIIDKDSSELIIIDSKKEDHEDKAISRCLVGGNIFFSVLYMLCFTIDDIRILSMCLAAVLGAWLALNDTLYFEIKKGSSIVGVLINEKGIRNKMKGVCALIK
ncbi:hypothetical protein [Serratia sp. Se-RSBMAAmG]|uniref:hypothetical protein n=1 Tax=Serratia sp. Se-RSBMAAmG TaxID=3043305 RepID=UPI0024AE9EBF|nr:hypothetical protein [Serratia sp. Se-RSBMAAmG]MDI6976247.1 hypothetical protein [Serratia sp. Se-RSBMAAmG]